MPRITMQTSKTPRRLLLSISRRSRTVIVLKIRMFILNNTTIKNGVRLLRRYLVNWHWNKQHNLNVSKFTSVYKCLKYNSSVESWVCTERLVHLDLWLLWRVYKRWRKPMLSLQGELLRGAIYKFFDDKRFKIEWCLKNHFEQIFSTKKVLS